MHTKDKLAAALREAGLNDMADRAATGYYHDFLSPLAMPELQLEKDLRAEVKVAESLADRKRANAIEAIRQQHLNGEFDASAEESEEWAKSQEGQETMRRLIDK